MILSAPTPRGRIGRGYMLAIIASITYGLNPLFALPLYADGFSVLDVLFYRYLGAAVLLAAYMGMCNITFRLEKKCLWPLLAAAVLFAASSYTLFESYRFMDVGIASTILYVTPFFVAIIMSTIFHQRLSVRGYLCILVAMMGIGLISVKYDSSIQSPVGIAFVVTSALVYSIYMVLLKETRLREMNPVALTYYCVLLGAFFFLLTTGFDSRGVILPTVLKDYLNIAGLALFPTIVSIVAMTVAIKIIGPVPTSILEALEPVTALVIGCFIFGERLTPVNIVGILIVITSVSYFVLSNRHKSVEKHVTSLQDSNK